MYCKGTVTVFCFFFLLLSYRGYLYRSLSRVPFCISVELNQMSQGRDTKSQLHRVQRRLPVPLSRRSVDDFQFWAGLKNVWECLSLNWNWAVFFFFLNVWFAGTYSDWQTLWVFSPQHLYGGSVCFICRHSFHTIRRKRFSEWVSYVSPRMYVNTVHVSERRSEIFSQWFSVIVKDFFKKYVKKMYITW